MGNEESLLVFLGKKYAELHPKEDKKGKEKEKTPKDEKPKQQKPKKLPEPKEEEEDDLPKEPKSKDPYAGLPKRYKIFIQTRKLSVKFGPNVLRTFW